MNHSEVAARDHELEKQSDGAMLALMEHRHRWTLDESNPERITVSEYARLVGRSQNVIFKYARAYSLYSVHAISPSDAYERAGMSADTAAATEAVATAHGVSMVTARQHYGNEVKAVRAYADTQVESGKAARVPSASQSDLPTYEDATRHYANWLRDAEKAEKKTAEERKERVGLRYAELDGKLLAARRDLIDALRVARVVTWGKDEQTLLLDTLRNVEKLLQLIDQAVTGTAPASIDWEAEINALSV